LAMERIKRMTVAPLQKLLRVSWIWTAATPKCSQKKGKQAEVLPETGPGGSSSGLDCIFRWYCLSLEGLRTDP
jgi:hypothetical protein